MARAPLEDVHTPCMYLWPPLLGLEVYERVHFNFFLFPYIWELFFLPL